MIGEPFPENGILRRGVLYGWKSSKPLPRRVPSPEVVEIIRRGEQKLYREYLERKQKRES